MIISAVLEDTERSVCLNETDQIATLTADELRQCLDALDRAKQAVNSCQKASTILPGFTRSTPPSRLKRSKVETIVQLIMSNWKSFENWSGGQLSQLCVFPKSNVTDLIMDEVVREAVRNQAPEVPVSEVVLKLLEGTPCAYRLIQKMRPTDKIGEAGTLSLAVQSMDPLTPQGQPDDSKYDGSRKRSASVYKSSPKRYCMSTLSGSNGNIEGLIAEENDSHGNANDRRGYPNPFYTFNTLYGYSAPLPEGSKSSLLYTKDLSNNSLTLAHPKRE
ncbi:hypothetical protein EV356DRAFT_571115 [Viridothelium virens]|uniref:Uncharacterized protein n=1 Tax=Viridothelium virens TaxID=1048519 RepID=A0A6A6GUJ5_VIRVR|nr:hypothetical protein EV356DRAFT_571115 [Viridothelium virens]